MAVNRSLPKIHVLHLENHSIFDQLLLEEALLRSDSGNWLIINSGTPDAIVMGISGQAEHLIDRKVYSQAPVPVIRRYSGGGTVFVDSHTLFVSFICNQRDAEGSPAYPDQIMQWTKRFYAPLFAEAFQLRENDYTLEGRKFGGNAQYLTKERWVHHTTLLWDFDDAKMNYLLLPPRRPKYRSDRHHSDFLCRLVEVLPSRQFLLEKLLVSVKHEFVTQDVSLDDAANALASSHRRATQLLGIGIF